MWFFGVEVLLLDISCGEEKICEVSVSMVWNRVFGFGCVLDLFG